MTVRATESRLPAGFEAADLGEAAVVVGSNGSVDCALVSYLAGPLAAGFAVDYVVFVTNEVDVTSYEWKAELIGEKSGISAFLYQQQRYRHFENVYAGIVMIGLIGLLTDQVLAFVGRYLFPWESGKVGLLRMVRTLLRRRGSPAASVVGARAS